MNNSQKKAKQNVAYHQEAASMNSATWTLTSPVQPVIQANISTSLWQITTETSTSSNLSVIQNSFLVLICMASYPVFWHKDGEILPSQERTCNERLENDTRFCINVKSVTKHAHLVQPINQSGSMLFLNATADIAGIYTCIESTLSNVDLATTIELYVHALNTTVDNPQIIQGGFERIRPLPPTAHNHQQTLVTAATVLSFVYTTPPGIEMNQSVTSQDQNHEPIYLVPFSPHPSPYIKITGLEITKLSDGIGQTTFNFHRYAFQHVGHYKFTLESLSRNGNASYHFQFIAPPNRPPRKAERIRHPFAFTSTFRVGNFYEIQVQPNIAFTWAVAVFTELIPDEDGRECNHSAPLLGNTVSKTCGIMGLSYVYETSAIESKILGVQVFLKAIKPCSLTVYMFFNESFESREKASIFISVLGRTRIIFPPTANRVHLAYLPVGTRSDIITYTNETAILRCVVPACQSTLLWCKFNELVEEWTVLHAEDLSHESMERTSNLLDSGTVSHDLLFPVLTQRHNGIYSCIAVFPRSLLKVSVNIFDVSVKDPVGPQFPDNKEYSMEEKILKQGQNLTLFCKPTGRPKPNIYWTRKEGDISLNLKVDSAEDEESLDITEPGTYICNATSRYGQNGRIFVVRYEAGYLPLFIALPLVGVVLLGAVLLVWWLRRKAVDASFKKLADSLKNAPTEAIPLDESAPLNDQISVLPYDCNYDVDKTKFTVFTNKSLGEGEFAKVYKGEMLLGESTGLVAVKMPREKNVVKHYEALVGEIRIMIRIRPHINVLGILGAYISNVENRELYLLTEFCENGSLKDYLFSKSSETDIEGRFINAPSVEMLLNYACQAANGMEYLAAQPVIHRDLALRNLLLNRHQIVKVSDFGLSRRHKLYRKRTRSLDDVLPIYWMALESLIDLRYSEKSDVWSFGVLLWEMFNCGENPFPDDKEDREFEGFCYWLLRKNRLGTPKITCNEIYKLMRDCWQEEPDSRPTFRECKKCISETLEERLPSMHRSLILALSQGIGRYELQGSLINNHLENGNDQVISVTAPLLNNSIDNGENNQNEPTPIPMDMFDWSSPNADDPLYIQPNGQAAEYNPIYVQPNGQAVKYSNSSL